MPDTWDTMTARERDARCARALRWKWYWWRIASSQEVVRGLFAPDNTLLKYWPQSYQVLEDESALRIVENDAPDYTTSHDAARLLLDEVSMQNKTTEFIRVLLAMHGMRPIPRCIDLHSWLWEATEWSWWIILNTTAEQQCHAACLALEGGER